MEPDLKYSGNAKRTVLIVDDEYINRQMLGYIVGQKYNVIYAENGAEALATVKENSSVISLILLDILMPVMNGFEFIQALRADAKLRSIPVIVLTSEKSAEVKSLQLGAVDFIKKPYDMPEVIMARVNRTIELSEDRTIIQSAEKDPLTGLYTRSFFFEYARLAERFHPGSEADASFIGIYRLRYIKELYGKEYGDKLVSAAAELIKDVIKDTDSIACRTDDDNFLIYSHSPDNICEKIVALTDRVYDDIPGNESMLLKAGIYPGTGSKLSLELRFDRARSAYESISSSYTDNAAIYDKSFHERDMLNERLIHDIHGALENNDLEVWYQPKYNIENDRPVLCSAEALIRWRHPELGMISPGIFIPLLEEYKLIHLPDQYTWRRAGQQIKQWRDKFGITVPVSVNVSRIDIYDPHISDKLLDILSENSIPVDSLYLEITESAYSDDMSHIISVVKKLRSHGFRIEMDDFGSGYSSLNMLNEMPVDIIKLDMNFIKNIAADERPRRLVKLIIDLASSLNIPVVSEGVEDEEQYRILKQIGCNVVQGYYFSKPLPPDEFEKLLAAEQK